MVWLVSEEAAFLKGKFVWANWDVKDMVAIKDELQKGLMLQVGLGGYPFEN